MARLRNIVHSGDACTLIFEGNKAKPEPSHGIIKFPGGNVEVARCRDGSYWAHISIDREMKEITGRDIIIKSRIDYDHEHHQKHGIPDIPDAEHIEHIACNILIKG